MNIGASRTGGDNTHGDIDDFAVFATALTSAEIDQLAKGTPPDKVRPITVTPTAAKFTKFARNPDGSITIEWTGSGTLQEAVSVTGPWKNVPEGASPYTFRPSTASLFGRIKN